MVQAHIRAAYPSKSLLGQLTLDDYGFTTVRQLLREIGEVITQGGGYISAAGVGLDAPAIDTLRVSGGAIVGISPGGYIFKTANGTYKFPNTVATTYYVYGSWCEIISGVSTNPRTGLKDRTLWIEDYGFTGTPDSVVDNGDGTITFVVDTLLGAAGPHVDRAVAVWTVDAQSAGQGKGSGVVVWDGVNNKVTTITADSLDQPVVSTVAADYVVKLTGPRVLSASSSNDKLLLIGTVVGTGLGNQPGVPLGQGNTDTQKHFSASMADTLLDAAAVIRRDAHNSPKIIVTADATDADDPQISVKDAALATQWKVDEDGDQTLGDGLAANSPSITKKSTGGNITFQNVNGDFAFTLPNGKTFEIKSAAASAILKISALLSAAGVLSFKDVNATAAIPFSAAAPDDVISAGLRQTILGGINENWENQTELFLDLHGFNLLAGGAVTDGGGLDADIAEAEYQSGAYHVEAATSIACPDASTRYLRFDGSAYSLSATLGIAGQSMVYLAKIVTAGGVITSITDLRRLAANLEDRPLDIYVGGTTNRHFANLDKAVAFAKEYLAAGKAIRILINGSAIPGTTPILIDFDGLVIEGVPNSGPSLVWGTDGAALFELSGCNGLVVRNLRIRTDFAAGGTLRYAFKVTGTNKNIRLRDLHFDRAGASGAHAFMYPAGGGGELHNSTIADCTLEGSTDYGIYLSVAQGLEIRNCLILKGATVQTTNGDGIRIEGGYGTVVASNIVDSWEGTGITFDGIDASVIRDNYVKDTGDDGIVIDGNSDNIRVLGNRTSECGDLVTAYGISVMSGLKTIVCENDAKGKAAAAAKAGINLAVTPGSDYAIVCNNQTNSQGINDGDAGAGPKTIANNRDDA